jgi:hypothetical protein
VAGIPLKTNFAPGSIPLTFVRFASTALGVDEPRSVGDGPVTAVSFGARRGFDQDSKSSNKKPAGRRASDFVTLPMPVVTMPMMAMPVSAVMMKTRRTVVTP